jgi:protein ImuB
MDRLAARLGPRRVLSARAVDTHLPEDAEALAPAVAADGPGVTGQAGRELPAGAPPTRPLRLFARPEPVEAMAEIPDGPPLRFRWRRMLHEIIRAEGPERIAGEWWRRDTAAGLPDARDYYRVEDRQGRRFWLYREGFYAGAAAPRWFLHGLFA